MPMEQKIISKFGLCKFNVNNQETASNEISIPEDVNKGHGIQLKITYRWDGKYFEPSTLDSTPIIINNEGQISSTYEDENNNIQPITLEENGKYAQSNCLTVNIDKIKTSTSAEIAISQSIKEHFVYSFESGTRYECIDNYIIVKFLYKYTEDDIDYIVDIKVKIRKPSKYDKNVVFTEEGIKELLTNIKEYPVIGIEGTAPTTEQQPYITVHHGSDPNNDGTKIKIGSVINFPASEDNDSTGTFRVSIDGTESLVTIKGFGSGSTGSITLGGDLIPGVDNSYDIGTLSDIGPNTSGTQKGRWKNFYITGDIGASSDGDRIGNIYATTGNFTNLIVNGNTINTTNLNKIVNGSSDTTKVFWRGDCQWSNELVGPIKISSATGANGTTIPSASAPSNNTGADFWCTGAGYFGRNLTAAKVFNAVFNDYAECRTTIDLTPGHVVIDQDDGSLTCSTARLQPGAQVISDTFGHSMGETDTAKTPIAVAGRVLVYPYQPRENYHAGMAVCSAPDGTVDIMTREEIRNYPDCIVGIVSEIPEYETWGSDNVKVDGRIWIRVK